MVRGASSWASLSASCASNSSQVTLLMAAQDHWPLVRMPLTASQICTKMHVRKSGHGDHAKHQMHACWT